MITADITTCPKCAHPKALRHHSNCGTIDWIACPKCRTIHDHQKEDETEPANINPEFWKLVEHDTQGE